MPKSKYNSGPWRLFISHSSKDKPFVRKLAEDLRMSLVPPWFDEWELEPGDSIIDKISDGLEKSSYLAIVLSPASVESGWVTEELKAALMEQISVEKVKVIPLLYLDCKIPVFLRDRKYIDFRSNYDLEFSQLLDFIQKIPQHEDLRFRAEQLANLFVVNGIQAPFEFLLESSSLPQEVLIELPVIALLALRSAELDDKYDTDKIREAKDKIDDALWNKPLKTVRELSKTFKRPENKFPEYAKDEIADESALSTLSEDELSKLILDKSILDYFRILAAKCLGEKAILQFSLENLNPIWNILNDFRTKQEKNKPSRPT